MLPRVHHQNQADPAEEQRHARQAQSRNRPLRQAQEAESIHEHRDQLVPHDREPHRRGSADFRNGRKHSHNVLSTDKATEPAPPRHARQSVNLRLGYFSGNRGEQEDQHHTGSGDGEADSAYGKRSAKVGAQQRINRPLNRQDRAGEKRKRNKNCFNGNSALVRWSEARSDSGPRDRESPLDVSRSLGASASGSDARRGSGRAAERRRSKANWRCRQCHNRL
jgi:hypothetical protein